MAKKTASKSKTVTGQPVPGFGIRFTWQTAWVALFDMQIDLLKSDIKRARAEDRVVVYLSCPISNRGGGYHGTNVDIAKHTERRLLADWGHRFWILNPAQYQMESKEGTGLILRHALAMKKGSVAAAKSYLSSLGRPSGGDYMRMWTKVLVENPGGLADEPPDLGLSFDAFYFLGPSDVRHFFTMGGARTVTAGIEDYFSRKFTMDPDFRDHYSLPYGQPAIDWARDWETARTLSKKAKDTRTAQRKTWEAPRNDFFRFYAVRASATFSKGCHDEWNILCLLNQARLNASGGDTGSLLAAFFDGRQVDPGAAVTPIHRGYAV